MVLQLRVGPLGATQRSDPELSKQRKGTATRLCLLASLTALVGCTKPTEEPLEHPTPPAPKESADDDGEDAEPRHESVATTEEPGEPDPSVESIEIDRVKLELVPDECVLRTTYLDEKKSHRFAFPAACHFSPDREGQVWVVATDHGNAVLVESSASLSEGGCDTALQLVVIAEKGPELSSQIQRVSGCGPGPWDEMMYHVLSAERVQLGTPAADAG